MWSVSIMEHIDLGGVAVETLIVGNGPPLLFLHGGDYVAQNRDRGIINAAALLIDFKTMEVLAQIGSSDFSNAEIHGQVDGTHRPRSPGSTLKPFVYALALDQGKIHPLSLLKDAPHTRPVSRLDEAEAAKRLLVRYEFDRHPTSE